MIQEAIQSRLEQLDTFAGTDDFSSIRPVRLGDLQRPVPGGPDELLLHRFLCRGCSAFLIGPTGIGKSALAMQMLVAWAAGRPVFGIEPTRPLRIWLMQAENDEGDLAEMRDGVVAGMIRDGIIGDADARIALENIEVFTESGLTFDQLGKFLDQRLSETEIKPDLLVLDPVFAFLGADASSQAEVSEFLRGIIAPVLQRHRVALLAVHHMNKPSKESSGDQPPCMLSYTGAGSAEWANWPRAVLVMQPLKEDGQFMLVSPKRGKRLGWKGATGKPAIERRIAHSDIPGIIYWLDMEGKVEASAPASTREEQLLALVAEHGGVMPQAELADEAKKRLKIGRDSFQKLKKSLLETGKLHEERVKSDSSKLIGLDQDAVTTAAGERDRELREEAARAKAATTTADINDKPLEPSFI